MGCTEEIRQKRKKKHLRVYKKISNAKNIMSHDRDEKRVVSYRYML